MPSAESISNLVERAGDGDAEATERLFSTVYQDLRGLAGSLLRIQRAGHTLQPTALVHEAYLRLVRRDVAWDGRQHFVGVAAKAMRQILMNHARDRGALKRGGDWARVTLDGAPASGAPDVDLLDLNAALEVLETLDERQCRIVELRFFGGLSVSETAMLLDVSEPTVKRDWRMARAWLFQQLGVDST